jgi:hypothetical protein
LARGHFSTVLAPRTVYATEIYYRRWVVLSPLVHLTKFHCVIIMTQNALALVVYLFDILASLKIEFCLKVAVRNPLWKVLGRIPREHLEGVVINKDN